MKKRIAWILTLTTLCMSLTACGGQETPQSTPNNKAASQISSEEMHEITHRLLEDWYKYAVRCELLYGDMRWALSYLDPFFEDHSWDNLQIARAAMNQAKLRAEVMEPFEAQMSFDDYDRLLQSGASVSFAQFAVNSIQTGKDAVYLDYQVYRNYLNSPAEQFFLNHDLMNLKNWAGLMQQIYDGYLLDCAIKTDYLLLDVVYEEAEAQFIEAITANCPLINACRKANPQDPDALLEKSNELGDEMEALINKLSSVIGQSNDNLERYRDAIELTKLTITGDIADYISAMSADAVELKDFPIALPYPDFWYNKINETFQYVWNNGESGKNSDFIIIWPGDTIETPPDQYSAKWEDVSLEEYETYINLLETYGIPAQTTLEEDGSHTTFYKFDSAYFFLSWKANTVSLYTMEGSVCFAPPWYLYYTRGISF